MSSAAKVAAVTAFRVFSPTVDPLSQRHRLVCLCQSLVVGAGLVELKHLAVEFQQVVVELHLRRRHNRHRGTLHGSRPPQHDRATTRAVERALEALPVVVEHALDADEVVRLRPLQPFRRIKIENAQSQVVGAGQLERAGRNARILRERIKAKLRLDLLVIRLHLLDFCLRITQPPHEQPVEVDLKPGPIRQGLDRQAGAGRSLRADIAALPGALDRGCRLGRRCHAAISENNEENRRRGDAAARPGQATIGRALSHRNARLDLESAGARSTSTTCRGPQGSDGPDASLTNQGLAIGGKPPVRGRRVGWREGPARGRSRHPCQLAPTADRCGRSRRRR